MTHEAAIAGRGISKRFGHVQALAKVSVSVLPGQIVAVVGDNGAGKSTLLRCLLGDERPDSGEVMAGGRVLAAPTVSRLAEAGVAGLYQDLALPPDLSVADAMFLGRESVRRGLAGRLGALDRRAMERRGRALLDELSVELLSMRARVAELSGGQRQAIALTRAAMWARTAILLDEPTAALGARQGARVVELMRQIAARGVALLLVSHDLPRVLQLADRIVVLRRGVVVHDAPAQELTTSGLLAAMVGHDAEAA